MGAGTSTLTLYAFDGTGAQLGSAVTADVTAGSGVKTPIAIDDAAGRIAAFEIRRHRLDLRAPARGDTAVSP